MNGRCLPVRLYALFLKIVILLLLIDVHVKYLSILKIKRKQIAEFRTKLQFNATSNFFLSNKSLDTKVHSDGSV